MAADEGPFFLEMSHRNQATEKTSYHTVFVFRGFVKYTTKYVVLTFKSTFSDIHHKYYDKHDLICIVFLLLHFNVC